MTRRARSGRALRTSNASASASSACRERSWNSSKMTSPTPPRSGSCLDGARQQRFGDDLDARLAADPGRAAHPVAGAPADGLAEELGDAGRNGRCREAPRLEHHDAPARQPRSVQQIRGHEGRLARARLCCQDERALLLQNCGYTGEERGERQVRAREVHAEILRAGGTAIKARRVSYSCRYQMPYVPPRGPNSSGYPASAQTSSYTLPEALVLHRENPLYTGF